MTRGVRSLLVVRLSAIGDAVHTLPALEVLRASLPGWKIGWAIEAEAAPLLEGHPALDALHVLDRRALGRAKGRTAALRGVLGVIGRERYDVAIDFQGLARSALVARLMGRRVIGSRHARELATLAYSGRLDVPAPGAAHAVERYLSMARAALAALGEREREAPLDRGLAHLRAEPAVELPADFVALLPGAGKAANRVAVSLLASVARRLRGRSFVVVGGKQDHEAGEKLAASVGALNLAGKLSLVESARVLGRASVVLGGDTGPLHIARALGVPVVGLFFAADPARTGPAGFPGSAPVTVVRGAAECAPCLARTCRRADKVRICLDAISPVQVAKAIQDPFALSERTNTPLALSERLAEGESRVEGHSRKASFDSPRRFAPGLAQDEREKTGLAQDERGRET